MQFSSRLPIAAHILMCIVRFGEDCKITSDFLAGSVNFNPVIIRKTLGQLKKAGLVRVEAGVGGASLAKSPEEITLLDIFRAVEPKEEPLFHFHENPNPACPVGREVHGILSGYLDAAALAMENQLRAVTIQQLMEDLRQKETTEKSSSS